MTELNGFKIKTENIHNLEVGIKNSTCPLCSHNRKKNKDKCLVIDWSKGIATCFHTGCPSNGEPIQLHEFAKKNGVVKDVGYSKPKIKLLKPLSAHHRDFLKSVRHLTDKVIDSNNIQTSYEFMTFPYYLDGEMVNWKQREIDKEKGFRQASGCRQTMYRIHEVKRSIEQQKKTGQLAKIIICEGEFDSLSWEVANCNYATSVSQGAPGENDRRIESKLACVFNDLEILKQADMIYLSVDKDGPGERLKKELIKLLQNYCTIMIIDHGNHKDANEVLINEGIDKLRLDFKNAKEAPKLKLELPEPKEEKSKIIKFPVEVFPEFVQELFQHLREVKSYENSFMAISLMGVIGTIAGARQVFDSGQYMNKCLIMAAMVAPPSVNKSAPLRDFLKPIEQINSVMRDEYSTYLEIYEANEALPKNSLVKEKMKPPRQKQIIFENTTVEAVHRMHSENKDGLLCKADELRTWFDSLGQYKASGKGSDVGFYLANFNGDSYTINRVEKSLHIDVLHINIVGGIQPDKLAAFPTDNGFLQRFIFALPENEPTIRSRKIVDKGLLQTYNDYINTAYNDFLNMEGDTIYEMTEGASEVFYNYLDELRLQEIDKEVSSVFSQFLGKLTVTFHRFCLILRILDHTFDILKSHESLFIGTEHVENAIKLTNYFIQTAKKVIENKDNTKEMQRVGYGKGETTIEMILRMYKVGSRAKDIADFIGRSRSYIYKVINDDQKKMKN